MTSISNFQVKGRWERAVHVWIAAVVVLIGCLALTPLWIDAYSLTVVRDALIFGLLALSLDFLWGKSGLLSFGHAAFFGIGAYGMAIIGPKVAGANAALAGLLVGEATSMAVAGGVGYFLIFGGVRGPYFTIVTLAISLVAQHIAIGWSQVTGGDAGLIGAPPPGLELFGFSYSLFDPVEQYFLVLAIAALCLGCLWFACRGHYGRVLAAIQDNEMRARSLGYDTSLHLLILFIVSAGIAALAGALYAVVSGYVAPDLVGLLLSTEIIVWVAVGGRGTLIGPMIGAFLIVRLQQRVSSIEPRLWPMIVGLIFVAMVFLFPDGVLPILRRSILWVMDRVSGRERSL